MYYHTRVIRIWDCLTFHWNAPWIWYFCLKFWTLLSWNSYFENHVVLQGVGQIQFGTLLHIHHMGKRWHYRHFHTPHHILLRGMLVDHILLLVVVGVLLQNPHQNHQSHHLLLGNYSKIYKELLLIMLIPYYVWQWDIPIFVNIVVQVNHKIKCLIDVISTKMQIILNPQKSVPYHPPPQKKIEKKFEEQLFGHRLSIFFYCTCITITTLEKGIQFTVSYIYWSGVQVHVPATGSLLCAIMKVNHWVP